MVKAQSRASAQQAVVLQPVRQQLRKLRRYVVLTNGRNPCRQGIYSSLHENAHQDVRIGISSYRIPDHVGERLYRIRFTSLCLGIR